jgi:hypothetical protein
MKWVAMRRVLRSRVGRFVSGERNRDIRHGKRPANLWGPCARTLRLSDKLRAELVKQLSNTVDTPGRLDKDHQVFWPRSWPLGNLQACP